MEACSDHSGNLVHDKCFIVAAKIQTLTDPTRYVNNSMNYFSTVVEEMGHLIIKIIMQRN